MLWVHQRLQTHRPKGRPKTANTIESYCKQTLRLVWQSRHPTCFQCDSQLITSSYLSHWCPVVKSLQPWHFPVWGWQYSLWPLHWHGLHWGKPQKPGRQWEHWRPVAPGTHSHWPVASWQKAPTEPWGSHSQAEGKIWINTLLVTELNKLQNKQLRPVLTSAAGGAEQEHSRGTVVTVPAHNVGSTLALTATGLTHCTTRTLWVALACWEIRRVEIYLEC